MKLCRRCHTWKLHFYANDCICKDCRKAATRKSDAKKRASSRCRAPGCDRRGSFEGLCREHDAYYRISHAEERASEAEGNRKLREWL